METIQKILNLTVVQKIQKMLVISLLVALVSQVNLELFESDFVVSAGVIIYVIFLYHYEDILPVPFGFFSGLMVFVLRLLVHEFTEGLSSQVVSSYMPEVVFYVVYAVFYTLFLENDRKDNYGFIFIVFIICDFASNFIEVFVRYTVLSELSIIRVIPTLLVVSVIRSSVVWVVLTAFNYYNILLTKREHEERYKRLLLLTSQLKTELYWIEKNMDNIDKVMEQSYQLLEKLNCSKDSNNDICSKLALNIARNVNEIKKDNMLVVRGINEITDKQLKDKGMEYKDISSILCETVKKECIRNNKENIEFEFNTGMNFFTYKHYYLMTVLRNLVINSMDSIRKSQKDGKISVIHESDDEQHVFLVIDNGSGIHEEYLKQIFSTGFSTKVDCETGVVNRGLGLCIVKCIIEENLLGHIEISSKIGVGTTIKIIIPREALEEKVEEEALSVI